MSIAMNRAKLPFVVLSSVLIASCAAPTTRFGAKSAWRAQASPPEFVTLGDDRPPMILPETYYAAARLFESRGKYLKARDQYRKAVAVNHSYVEAFHRLGLVHSFLGERASAVKALARAVELRPDDSILRNNLAFEYILCEQWEEANKELLAAIRLDAGFARAHINLGIVQSRLQRFDLALASFRAVLPEADAHYNLGLMYRGQERYEEATAAFERVLEIDPEFGAAWKQLRQVRVKLARRARHETPVASLDAPRPEVVEKIADAKYDSIVTPSTTTMVEAPETVTQADLNPAQIDVSSFPEKTEGDVDLMTADIGYLLALADSDPDCLEEYRLASAEIPSVDGGEVHESVETLTESDPVALWDNDDEFEMDTASAPFGEDMPDHVEMSIAADQQAGSAGFSALPEEDFWVAPTATPALTLLLCDSEFIAPPPAIASESDWLADARDPDDDCDDFLLVDLMQNIGSWFSVPMPITPFTTGPDGLRNRSDDAKPDACSADAQMILSVISSFGRNAPERRFTPADPVSAEPEAVASIDARAVLRQLEDELATAREEIRCLELMDEEPKHAMFAIANDHGAMTRSGVPRTLPSNESTSPLVSAPPAEMGPPAPSVSLASSRVAKTRPVRARLAASNADQRRRGKGDARSFQVIEYEIRETPAVALATPPAHRGRRNEPARLAEHPQRAGDNVSLEETADLDGWVSIVMNELACLENSAQGMAARNGVRFDDLVDPRDSIDWHRLDVFDQLILPGNPLFSESDPLGPFPSLPAPSIPGLRRSDIPRGDYGHEVERERE